jgi:meiotic recombination protein SPO11
MSTYKYGSIAHAHESSRLNAPRLEWLGTRVSDVITRMDSHGDDPLISLSRRDLKKARSMLANSPVLIEGGPEPEWRAELQTMLMLNLKVETEILYGRDGGLEGWIDRKMTSMSTRGT